MGVSVETIVRFLRQWGPGLALAVSLTGAALVFAAMRSHLPPRGLDLAIFGVEPAGSGLWSLRPVERCRSAANRKRRFSPPRRRRVRSDAQVGVLVVGSVGVHRSPTDAGGRVASHAEPVGSLVGVGHFLVGSASSNPQR